MANPRPKRRRYDLWDILLILAILPGTAVGAAVYSFNFDPMRVIAWFIGGDSRQLWHYFWWYVLGAVAVVFSFIGWLGWTTRNEETLVEIAQRRQKESDTSPSDCDG